MTRALILGIGGQDGSYLMDELLARGREVAGFYRHSSVDNLVRIAHRPDSVKLYRGDVTDLGSVRAVVEDFRPDEIYNVADQDRVDWSRDAPDYQRRVTFEAVRDLVRWLEHRPGHARVKVFQPISCTVFGPAPPPQNEAADADPAGTTSPYALNKLKAWHACRAARAEGVRVWCGVMFNHDSPRRAPGYVLQDVCRQAVDFMAGRTEGITVRTLAARVDVGSAKEYMAGVVDMLDRTEPGDYCLGTGTAWSVGEMLAYALDRAGCMAPHLVVRDSVRESHPAAGLPGPVYQADIGKARRDFGFEPTRGPMAVIGEVVEHLLEGGAP